MASKRMRKLGIGMSVLMMATQISGTMVFAAPEEDGNGEFVFTDEAEDEDTDNLSSPNEEIVPPTNVKWEKPGAISFQLASSDASVSYQIDVTCARGSSSHKTTFYCGSLGSWCSVGDTYTYHVPDFFEESGTYTAKVYVVSGTDKIYSDEIPQIEWIKPEQKVPTADNLQWAYQDSEHFAIAVCDPVENATQYWFNLYEDNCQIYGQITGDTWVDFSDCIKNIAEHDYTFSVFIPSDDLTKYANSEESNQSVEYNPETVRPYHSGGDVTEGIAINEQNFPDEVFRKYVSDNFDTSKNGVLSNEEIASAKDIDVEDHGITSLKGIEYFSNLTGLWCSNNKLSDLDVTKNTKLIDLYCDDNYISSLDVHANTALEVLYCSNNKLKSLDVSKNTELTMFDCSTNSIEKLNIDENAKLENLLCYENQLSVLNVAKNPALVQLSCFNNRLSSLDISNNIKLQQLGCNENNIKEINIVNNEELKNIYSNSEGTEMSFPYIVDDKVMNYHWIEYSYNNGYISVDSSTKIISTKEGENDKSDGIYQESDGSFYYYKDGSIDTDMNGYVDWNESKFYIKDGKVDTTVNGVMIDGAASPLVWYFCSNGQVQTQHVGLAEYDGEWFYIENGKVATDMNAFVEYNGGLFAVGAGRIIGEYNGLMQDPQDPVNGAWYYFAGGQAQTQYTGLAMYDNVWFYVVKGKLATDYTGTVEYDGATFNVTNGMVTTSESSGETGNTISAADLSIEITNMDQFWGEYNRVLSDYATNKGWTAWTYDDGFGLQILLKKENVVELRFEDLDSRDFLPNPVYVAVGEYDAANPEVPYDVNEFSFDIDIRTLGDVKNLMDKY